MSEPASVSPKMAEAIEAGRAAIDAMRAEGIDPLSREGARRTGKTLGPRSPEATVRPQIPPRHREAPSAAGIAGKGNRAPDNRRKPAQPMPLVAGQA